MTELRPSLRELLHVLSGSDLDFVLVGGLAVGAWGRIRATEDIDLIPDPDRGNLDRLAEVLRRYGGRVIVGERRLKGDAIALILKSGDLALIDTELGQVDVLQGVPHIPRYEEALAESEVTRVDGAEVRVCSLRHLAEMKLAASRPQDLEDLEGLKVAQPDFDWDSFLGER